MVNNKVMCFYYKLFDFNLCFRKEKENMGLGEAHVVGDDGGMRHWQGGTEADKSFIIQPTY